MKDFFKGQFDYIYFFYGFSFFLLAIICFTLDKNKLRRFPWVLLGFFGLTHSIAEWLDMLMIIYGKKNALSILGIIALCASYLCLLEFARVGYFRLRKKRISPWIYLIFPVLLSLGHKYGLNGWIVTSRYFLGFTSGYLASRIIYEFAIAEKESRYPLKYLSIIFSLYAVATGLIVPKTGFLLSKFLNFDSFYETFGTPIQLIRAILALAVALAIWFYSSVPSEIKYKPPRFLKHYVPTKWTIGLTLIILIIGGWMFTNYLDYYARRQMIVKNINPQRSPVDGLTRELTKLQKVVISVSRVQSIRNAVSLEKPESKVLEETNKILSRYQTKFNALDFALLDKDGVTVASAGSNKTEIEKGKNYASKPYFKKAIAGETGYDFRHGATYNERIYYISYPVKDIEDKISGAIVITKNIQTEPLFSYRLFSILITFFVCLIVIIFFMVLKRREAFIGFIEKTNARLEEVDKLKTDFISIVSHELRTPLTSIKNAASIMMKGGASRRAIDEQEKEMIRIILNNVDRQTKMVNDLLDVSKIEAGAISVAAKIIDIASLAKNVLNSLRPIADSKKISIIFLSATDKEMAYSDPDHTARIFNNLIDNAIKFTPNGGKITVKIENARAYIKILVSDTGIGISKEDKEKIFTKFCIATSAENQIRKGCGLGLVITKGLVETLGGKIWLESEPGKGSAFYFTLPAAKI
ncbi:MAG: ATP-binding protein [Candidatus Omnitrophica bacterium]|nr:ATP-binding protein [Candidatus Omnitrophota bacterium]